MDCKLLLLRKIMTVLNREVTANYVPAAAVKRRSQALSGITGVKGAQAGDQVGSEIHGLNP